MHPTLILLSLLALFWLYSRGREQFRLSIRSGRLLVISGRAPLGFVEELRELVAAGQVQRGLVRGVIDGDRFRLLVSPEVEDGLAQRMRNIFALYPPTAIRRAPRVANPNLGQRLGIAWLAWRLHRGVVHLAQPRG